MKKRSGSAISSVGTPDQDPQDRMFLGFLNPDQDPLVRGTDPDSAPDPSLFS